MATSFNRIRPPMKMSNSSDYRNTVFGNSNSTIHPSLFNAESRIHTWPWFYFNDLTNSSAATAAAMAFSKLNQKKDKIQNVTSLDAMKHREGKSSSYVPFPSKFEGDVNKCTNNWTSKEIIGSSDDGLQKRNVSPSLPSSPFGNISTSSSPKSLDNDCRSIGQEKSVSPLGSPRQTNKISVINM